MSILLDAIMREKQQKQGQSIDLTQPSVASYSTANRARFPYRKMSLLMLATAAGVAGAWGVSQALKPKLVQVNAESQLNLQQPQSVDSKPLATSSIDSQSLDSQALATQVTSTADIEPSDGGIRVAGKVALPVPKAFNAQVVQSQYAVESQVVQGDNGFTLASVGASTEPLSLELLQAMSEQDPSLASADNSAAYEYSAANGAMTKDTTTNEFNIEQAELSQPSTTYQAPENNLVDNEPIILGANPNQKGLAQLEALRLSVESAAAKEDFSSIVAQPKTMEQGDLLSAFQTALNDVEYEQSANKSITQTELDPIPKAKNNVIPRYGDLPASLQLQVPEFSINAHVYSSDPSSRWLNVDGVELQQGDKIKDKLTIIEIRPRDVILDIDGEEFRVPAI